MSIFSAYYSFKIFFPHLYHYKQQREGSIFNLLLDQNIMLCCYFTLTISSIFFFPLLRVTSLWHTTTVLFGISKQRKAKRRKPFPQMSRCSKWICSSHIYFFCIHISLESNLVLLPRNKWRSFFSTSTNYSFMYISFLVSRYDINIQISLNLRVQNMFRDNINSNKKASWLLLFSSTVHIL